MSEVIELRLIPVWMIHPKSEQVKKNDFRIYDCLTRSSDIELNSREKLSIKGVMQKLEMDVEYTAQIQLDKIDPRYGASYNVLSIYREVPETLEGQKHSLPPCSLSCS